MNKYIIVILMFILSTVCSAQKLNRPKNIRNVPKIYPFFCFVDTITIQDPILIEFKEKQTDSRAEDLRLYPLVSKVNLDSNNGNSSKCINYLMTKDVYLWYSAIDFMQMLKDTRYASPAIKSSPYYFELKKHYLEDKEMETVARTNDSTFRKIQYKGWECREVIPRKFLLCLVNGSVIRGRQTIGAIDIENMDYVYFRVLVPITW